MGNEVYEDALYEHGLRNIANGNCFHCGNPITWDGEFFVDEAKNNVCPDDKHLHQG